MGMAAMVPPGMMPPGSVMPGINGRLEFAGGMQPHLAQATLMGPQPPQAMHAQPWRTSSMTMQPGLIPAGSSNSLGSMTAAAPPPAVTPNGHFSMPQGAFEHPLNS